MMVVIIYITYYFNANNKKERTLDNTVETKPNEFILIY